MPTVVEPVAARVAAALLRDGFEMREARVGGMGSLRTLVRGRLVVSVNDDRGTLGIGLGLHPAPRMDDAAPVAYWAQCLGLRGPVVHAAPDLERGITDAQALRDAESQAADLERVLARLAGMPHEEVRRVEACAWAHLEAWWRDQGWTFRPRTPPE